MAGVHLSFSGIHLSHPSTSRGMILRPRMIVCPSSYSRRTIINCVATQNLSYWDSIHSDIDSHLKKAIPIREPVSVFEPMHHLTFSPSKTNAPALCVAACELVGGNREDAIVAASAIHLMHVAIYTREHLCISDQSKSEPKIPHRFGPNIELLTVSGILPFGFELLAGSMNPANNNSDKLLRVMIEITRAVGAQGMVNHENNDNKFNQSSGQPSRRLHGCGAACGAILGGGTDEEIERLKTFGVYVGKIEGLLSNMGQKEGDKKQLVEKWRALAIKELEYFDNRKIEQISTLVKV